MRHAGAWALGIVLALAAARAQTTSIFDTVKTGTPEQVRALAGGGRPPHRRRVQG